MNHLQFRVVVCSLWIAVLVGVLLLFKFGDPVLPLFEGLLLISALTVAGVAMHLHTTHITKLSVRKYGPECEANPRMRRMYERNNFKPYYVALLVLGGMLGLDFGIALFQQMVHLSTTLVFLAFFGMCFLNWLNDFRVYRAEKEYEALYGSFEGGEKA